MALPPAFLKNKAAPKGKAKGKTPAKPAPKKGVSKKTMASMAASLKSIK